MIKGGVRRYDQLRQEKSHYEVYEASEIPQVFEIGRPRVGPKTQALQVEVGSNSEIYEVCEISRTYGAYEICEVHEIHEAGPDWPHNASVTSGGWLDLGSLYEI